MEFCGILILEGYWSIVGTAKFYRDGIFYNFGLMDFLLRFFGQRTLDDKGCRGVKVNQ